MRHTGYHWALVLSPKDRPNTEQDQSEEPDSIRWHLSNEARGSDRRRHRGQVQVPWYLEKDPVNMFKSISLIARFTIGKFKMSEHDAVVQRIDAAIDRVPIDHSDPNLSCRTWLLQVVDILMSERLIELSVPNVAELESRAVHEGNEIMRGITERRININSKSAIPIIDMRATQG